MKTQFYLLKTCIILAFAAGLGLGCTGTSRLKENEKLYTGAKIHITKTKDIGSTKLLKTDLKKAVILPRPNKKILWMRPRLVIYNIFKTSREKSFGSFVANRLGEPPVIFEPKTANRHLELLKERAGNTGFFKVKINSREKATKRKVKLHYDVQVRSPQWMSRCFLYVLDTFISLKTLERIYLSSCFKRNLFV